jgi:phosphoribosyl 1,2-cyclic phosphate phosphodiesterase
MIEISGKVIVIDTGPDFRAQMLREDVTRLDAVLLTHAHKDHTGGLDDVRSFNFSQEKPMDVFARAEVQKAIHREFLYAFSADKYPGVPQIIQHTVKHKAFTEASVTVIPVEAEHYTMKVAGYRISNFAYLTDASFIAPKEKQKLKGLDVFVLNALRVSPHYSHYNLEQALELIAELKPKQAFLTHISHLMGRFEEMKNKLPSNVQFAYDGLKIDVCDNPQIL